mgnify:CR=1 FL=1
MKKTMFFLNPVKKTPLQYLMNFALSFTEMLVLRKSAFQVKFANRNY